MMAARRSRFASPMTRAMRKVTMRAPRAVGKGRSREEDDGRPYDAREEYPAYELCLYGYAQDGDPPRYQSGLW